MFRFDPVGLAYFCVDGGPLTLTPSQRWFKMNEYD